MAKTDRHPELNFGCQARDKGIERVMKNTGDSYKEAVNAACKLLSMRQQLFTAEDIREIVGDPPHHPNVLGACIMLCVRAGVIRPVGYGRATRPAGHARVIRTYL